MARTLVSCDDHMDMAYVPRDLWQSRVPAAVRDRAPKVEETPSGPLWVREGERWGVSGSKRADGRKVVFDMLGLPEEAEPGVFRPASPKYRLEDMERDGIYAQVIYGFLDWSFRDHSLKADCMQAYNTWLWEGLCSASPDRLVGLANLPGHDPEGSVGELYRVLDMGLRGAVFDCFKAAKPIFDMAWEPLWSAAEETGAVISVHIGGGTHQSFPVTNSPVRDWASIARVSIVGMQLDEILTCIIMSGILIRHPKLKMVLGESGIGWIPFVLERMEWEQENYAGLAEGIPIAVPPTELFRRQMYATFQDEKLGVRLIPDLGVDNAMWASDYPHGDGTYPHSPEAVERIFEGVSPAITEKVVDTNCRGLYGIA